MKKMIRTICLLLGLSFLLIGKVQAEETAVLQVTGINYEDLTLTVKPVDKTSIVYYSEDKDDWNELEYLPGEVTDTRVMDISWISATAEKEIYLREGKEGKVVTIALPKRNTALKVTFDKAEGILEFDEYEDATTFQWRKSTDYTWQEVPLNENSIEWKAFLEKIETLRTKGSKIVVRTPGINGTSADDTGVRPSKEVTVTIGKRNNAPTVTLNIKKLTLNTKETQEYSLDPERGWTDCDTTMELADLAPQVLVSGGARDVTLYIRTAATDKAGHSKIQALQIAGQRAVPAMNELSYYYEGTKEKAKLVIQFPSVTEKRIYEYVVIKPEGDFEETTAAWKTVKSTKVIKLSQAAAPEGSTIYFRYKGTAANKSKGTNAVLPSDYQTFRVSYKGN